MNLRYLSSVVAPMHRSSPRDSRGFSRIDASITPPPCCALGPVTVWMSSMKRMYFAPSTASVSSCKTFFMRSSNSPGMNAPAMSIPMSSAITEQPASTSGTSPAAMRSARPSTSDVLPTPGSPRMTGLFLVRRDRMLRTRRSSSLRPTTGSSFPAFAISVRFRVNFDRAVWCSGTSSSLLVPRLKMARDLRIAALIWSSDSPCAHSKISVNLGFSANESTKCSTVSFSSFMVLR
mmetsp:Transcript_42788/g.128472  ORF Transcript_42788/g.128472 Transcript_42788/m.128472 type:complete len:234 (-) Transcript_42788:324-1025(-)